MTQKAAWAARADRYGTQARILRKSAAEMDAGKAAKLLAKADAADEKARAIRDEAMSGYMDHMNKQLRARLFQRLDFDWRKIAAFLENDENKTEDVQECLRAARANIAARQYDARPYLLERAKDPKGNQ